MPGQLGLAALPGRSLVRAFRQDRFLAAAFLALSLGSLAPLFATPVLPFPDLAGDTAASSLLVRTALGQAGTTDYYRVVWLPFPYWTTYLLRGTLSLVVGPFLSAKVLVGLLVLLLPLALMRLLLAFGRDPRLALGGFLLSWEHNLYAGWHSYVMAMALAFVVLAKVVEAEDERAALRVLPWSLLLALTHAMAVLFVLLAGLLLVADGRQARRRLKLHAIALSGSALMVVPWIVSRLRSFQALERGGRFVAEYPSVWQKANGFFSFSLDNLGGSSGESVAVLAMALLLLAPLVLASLPRDESTAPAHRWGGVLVMAAALGLYAALPFAVYGPISHWYTYPRYASYVLASLLLVPPVTKVRAALLVPIIAVALAGNVVTARAFHSFGERVRPFLEIADAVPAGARLLPLEYVSNDPVVKAPSLAHLHSYISARGLYDPHLFDNPDTPIRYRPGLSIPRPGWFGPMDFTLARYGAHYDHVLVQGKEHDPFAGQPSPGFRVTLKREAGMWRLYTIAAE